jgi:DNA repair protein RadD
MTDVIESDFLTVAQAAIYIGVSAATLRRWDESGKLTAIKRPGSEYRYYKLADLEQFRLEFGHAEANAGNVDGFFSEAKPNIQRNSYLREPQREAFDAAVTHFSKSTEPAIVQLPVGCGKTGLAAILPFGLSVGRVLVIAPNTTIRSGLYADLNISNAECFWKKTSILTDFSKGPFVALVDGPKANMDDCMKSHIVVANIQQLASKADRWLSQFPSDFFDLVIIDEGHHAAAESWQRVIRAFPNARFVSMTATPFRADNQDLVGKLIYRYPFSLAMINGYIKHVSSASARPTEISFSVKDESRTFSIEEVLQLKEDAWFRRGVALSEECNRHIAEKSVEKLREIRSHTGYPHQIIASAMSIDHARQVRAIYEEMGLQAAEIYSEMPDDRKETVFAKLRSGQIDCIVQVAMLGEGFDHPPLSIAAIFRPYRSLSPYIQFVGRIMRTVEPNDPDNPNNQGYIVTHVGLNNEERWDDFRELDAQDQELVKGWARGTGGGGFGGSPAEPVGDDSQQAQRFDDQPVADNEILSHFLSQAYLDPEDDTVINQILDAKGPGGLTFRDLGITAEKLRDIYAARNTHNEAPAASQPIQPQVHRQTLRKRLDERSKSVHNRILTDLGMSRAGYDISRNVPGVRGNNADALFSVLNNQIDELVGQGVGTRENWSLEQLDLAYKSLDQVADGVVNRIKEATGRN